MHEGGKAAGEFQKIIDQRIVVLNPVGSLAQLGLARGLWLARRQRQRPESYQDFLTLWKDADPTSPS